MRMLIAVLLGLAGGFLAGIVISQFVARPARIANSTT